jgi:CobQ/CobB/MinD/ParA nucleotide binding domain
MNFNDALEKATQLAQARLPDLKEHVFLVRDLHGRIRILLGKRRQQASEFYPHIQGLIADITQALGTYAYPADDLIMYREELKSIQLPDDGRSAVLAENGGHKVCLHDRLLMGAEWSASPPAGAPTTKRFTLFSMKGGVGRSTTATILGWHLAKKGKGVLVFDLDLESPGVGATLLGPNLPRFGIVDWFVEDALGQGAAVLGEMVRQSALPTGSGSITVVPAFGSDTGDYLAKLGRAYLERGPNGHEPWPSRLKRLVEAIERQETPDIVLLDSRTGLHDTSAALVLAMGADTLMFAVDTPQTWSAYGFLFKHWSLHPDRRAFREKLWVVGAQTPDTGRDDYLDALRDNAWDLFRETLYDAPGDGLDPDVFFSPADDSSGNHYPRALFWHRALMAFDPLKEWAENDLTAAYGGFLTWFDRVLLEEPEAP